MNKLLALSLFALSGALLGGCSFSKGFEGELVGSEDRPYYVPQEVPFGMVPCPGGTFHMGQTDQDISASMVNMNKQVTIAGFYMDETEITNNKYRQFIDAIKQDSLDVLGEEYVMTELYPDTTVWVRDFTYHMGDPLLEYYYTHPAFDDYPVVGVDWFAAKVLLQLAHQVPQRFARGSAALPPTPTSACLRKPSGSMLPAVAAKALPTLGAVLICATPKAACWPTSSPAAATMLAMATLTPRK